MSDKIGRFHARFQKVFEYIDSHLEDDLSLDELCNVAAFSKYHFHRVFSELYGISVYQYIQLCRLKKASYLLAFRESQPIIEVALASGFGGPESFSRSFRKSTGQSPSQFRQQPDWSPCNESQQKLTTLRRQVMNMDNLKQSVQIVDVTETPIAVLEHCGNPSLIGNSIRKFINWRKLHGLSPDKCATYNIFYNNPDEVEPDDYRLDICVATEHELSANDIGLKAKTLPSGRCAMLRHIGSDSTLAESIKYLYIEWLPQSGEELRDFPLYVQRVSFYPDVAENQAITDIFLPLI